MIETSLSFDAMDTHRIIASIYVAIKQNNKHLLSNLVTTQNFDVKFLNDFDADNQSPIMSAAKFGCYDCLRVLVEKGARVGESNIAGITPLMLASMRGDADIVRYILDQGADVNKFSCQGKTALTFACAYGRRSCVILLLEYGADVKAITEEFGWNYLMVCVSRSYVHCLQPLIDYGVDVNAASRFGWTSLMHASREGQYPIVKILLENCADCNMQDSSGSTALMRSVRAGNIDCVRLLVYYGAEAIDLVDRQGWTALMYASKLGYLQITRLLIESGADKAYEDGQGNTAITLAFDVNTRQIIETTDSFASCYMLK